MTEPTLRERTCMLWESLNPDLDTSPMEIVAQLKRLTGLLELAVEPIYADAELTVAEVELLVPLRYAEESVTAIQLAELLSMSRAGVSKALAKLERRGLIARAQNPSDRRSALILMTESGKAAIDHVFPRELEAHGKLFAGLGETRGVTLETLDRLARVMESGLEM
ncbi:MarR family winged helix-turn-helix transcriptional regulator [Rhodococcus qingshengii]|uniref:MarR family winged helix-turn-helix transcriptional regulator n=1 Tax=Rhodococcus qingshengii TaxID=334542 RepID=UPI0021B0A08A|nr:MarR family transcriptional regulator [Rhodococcus qingshengii]MCT6735304.1 MarR family transcriptional regulator [Rhodococcus qingshengii]